MDFIMVPLIMGIITLGIYKLFELCLLYTSDAADE